MNSWQNKLFRTLLLGGSLLLLSACGGSKTVVTQDDSADYRSAQTLPPLKKPAVPQAGQPAASNASAPQSAEPAPSVSSTAGVVANIVEAKNGSVELVVEAPSEPAWRFVRQKLNKSDLTVHSRNYAAGRFAIGCANLDADKPEVDKKNGWSVFRRARAKSLHCSLQLSSAKNRTVVKVLSRSGEPVSAESAREIFARLLNS